MKIGKAASSNGYVLADPQEFLARRPLDDKELGDDWTNFLKPISGSLGASWFEEYGAQPFTKWIQDSLDFTDEGTRLLLEQFSPMALDRYTVIPGILHSPNVYGEPIPLTESPLAQSILNILGSRNVNGVEVHVVGLSGMLMELDTPLAWMGAWGTTFGTRCHVWLEVRRDASGVERANFFVNLLVSTRAIEDTQVRQLTESIVIGRWCQTLLYLAETPFPSSLMSFPRDTAMDSLPIGKRPQPLAWIEDFALTASPIGNGSAGEVSVDFATYPVVLKLGYVIPTMPDTDLSEAINVAIDCLVNTASIVEDGFRYSQVDDSHASFDQIFFSEFEFQARELGAVNGYARWIPESLIGSLAQRTSENFSLSTQNDQLVPESISALQWIADNGAGASVAGAINILARHFLIPNRDFAGAAFYLQRAIDLDIVIQSTNAMVIYGAMLLEVGERESGEHVLLAALERFDGSTAEGEACFFLGCLYREDQDEVKARTYLERARQSEDPHFAALAEQKLLGREPAPTRQDSETRLARFCSNCGNAFKTDQQNFCGECGQRRG